MHSLQIYTFTSDFTTMRRIIRALPLKRPHPVDVSVQNIVRLEKAIDMSGMEGMEGMEEGVEEESVEIEVVPPHVPEQIARVVKPQVKWDEISESILLQEINSDARCMRVARPRPGMKNVFWKEVAEAVNLHSHFRNSRVSEKSAKEHYTKMVEKQKELMKNTPFRSGSAENSGPNALDLEDNIRGNISAIMLHSDCT